MVDIIDKLNIGEKNNTFQRVNSYRSTDVYLGSDEENRYALVFKTNNKIEDLKSSYAIKSSCKFIGDNKYMIVFSLEDDMLKLLFYKFCEDMVDNSNDIEYKDINKFIITRWNYWLLMFKSSNDKILSQEMIKGLLGELIFLYKYMFSNYGHKRSIESWLGPMGLPKDFIIDDVWYEIKSCNTSAQYVKISSIEQLDSNRDGFLVIMRLDTTSTSDNYGLNLNMYIKEIMLNVTDVALREMIMKKLDSIGYCYKPEYDNFNYIFKGYELYKVNKEFPRIRRSQIANPILKVQYDLLINEIEDFKEEVSNNGIK